MINLYMDDVRECPFPGWVVARTVEEAQQLLASGTVKHCSLDHDMGACADCRAKGLHEGDLLTPETTFMNWCQHASDGTKLVRWMMSTGHWPAEKPAVHSANPVGKQRMVALIDRYFGSPALDWSHK